MLSSNVHLDLDLKPIFEQGRGISLLLIEQNLTNYSIHVNFFSDFLHNMLKHYLFQISKKPLQILLFMRS